MLTNLGASPSITINAANGSGTMTALPANAGNGSTGNTLTFTYTAATGGMASGDVTVTAPAGWSAPSTTADRRRLRDRIDRHGLGRRARRSP